MQASVITDIILAAVFAICIGYGYKRGFMRAAYQIISFVLTVIIVFAFRAPVTQLLYDTQIGTAVTSAVQEKVNTAISKTDLTSDANAFVDELAFPEFISDSIKKSMQSAQDFKIDTANTVCENITDTLMTFLAAAILFASVRLGLSIVMTVLDRVCRLPLLNFMNKTAGGAVGVLNALIIVYAVCALVMFFTPAQKQPQVNTVISQTTLTKQFYNNNYLLKLLCLK